MLLAQDQGQGLLASQPLGPLWCLLPVFHTSTGISCIRSKSRRRPGLRKLGRGTDILNQWLGKHSLFVLPAHRGGVYNSNWNLPLGPLACVATEQ